MTTLQRISELRKEFPAEWQRERRIAYLKGAMTDLTVEVWQHMARHEDYVRRNRLVEMILTREKIDQAIKDILKVQGDMIRLKGEAKGKRPEITEAMIERARAYPFTQLYEFKRNMARCPFHEDHDPSFVLMKDNRARCFGACGRSWDTIAFLMDKEGLRFPEAVRQLQ
ncbi:MAG: DNA primase [Syntrophorhabdaceae bacterium PtaU1.Bin034]|jgi:hypothetical protein|nr:MAG: DNA primase [Syntrophorhabdaceae bacterium PtaU1.Bin034]